MSLECDILRHLRRLHTRFSWLDKKAPTLLILNMFVFVSILWCDRYGVMCLVPVIAETLKVKLINILVWYGMSFLVFSFNVLRAVIVMPFCKQHQCTGRIKSVCAYKATESLLWLFSDHSVEILRPWGKHPDRVSSANT